VYSLLREPVAYILNHVDACLVGNAAFDHLPDLASYAAFPILPLNHNIAANPQ
jgi:hypothetical protein